MIFRKNNRTYLWSCVIMIFRKNNRTYLWSCVIMIFRKTNRTYLWSCVIMMLTDDGDCITSTLSLEHISSVASLLTAQVLVDRTLCCSLYFFIFFFHDKLNFAPKNSRTFTRNSRVLPYRQYFKWPADVANKHTSVALIRVFINVVWKS